LILTDLRVVIYVLDENPLTRFRENETNSKNYQMAGGIRG